MQAAESSESGTAGHVLVVDDEADVRAAFGQALTRAGYRVDTADDGSAAVRLVQQHRFDAIVSDIGMPGMGGIDLLHAVRAHDLDVPVLLVTGGPSVETAARAVELGAFRYLLKPMDGKAITDAVRRAVAAHRLARVKREAQAHLATEGTIGDLAGLEVRFVSALKSLWMAYQPVVSWGERRVMGYEALVRSGEPALPHPGALLEAAERLNWVHELGRTIRDHIGGTASSVPDGALLLVNLHAQDLLDESLFSEDAVLTRHASQVILEITERAPLDGIQDVRSRVDRLRAMGYRIAIDDLGAGYAGLNSFAQLEPDVVKIDMALVRSVHLEPIKQRLIRSMVALSHDLDIDVIAEGVETEEERNALIDCGCDWLQGYLFAKPGRPFPTLEL